MTSSRRQVLRTVPAAAAVASTSVSGCMWLMGSRQKQIQLQRQQQRQQQQSSGQLPDVSFQSAKKRIKKADADRTVTSKSAFKTVVQKPNTTVWIPGGVTFDLTGQQALIAPGVTIASNRKLNGGTGALIQTTEFDKNILLVPEGHCRVTGIRLQGPKPQEYIDPPYENIGAYESAGIQFEGKSAVVDHCEAYGWTGQAFGFGTTNGSATRGWIHHNDLHHNQMNHLGYHIELFNGMHLIEWNRMALYRHAIAGYGFKTNGYEARFNVIGPPGGSPHAFALDMHNLGEQDSHPDHIKTAGKYVNVHHNVIRPGNHNAMAISGEPTKFARFANNWCSSSKDQAVSVRDGTNLRMSGNQFGDSVVDAGVKWLEKVAKKLSLSNGNHRAVAGHHRLACHSPRSQA